MDVERLGRFDLTEIIGRGGMGAVYAARDRESGESVALKVLSADIADDEEKFRRFEQEVAALSRLNHPNIVRLLGPMEKDGDRIFFPMERLAGESLSARLRREGPLPVPAALAVARPLFRALAAAHAAGIVHRDVKPSNLVLEERRVVLTDFGLARMEDITRLTMTGQLMGTLDYMSPEQCEGTNVDHRSDLYSGGIVLYEMLSGEPPFRQASPGAVLKGHLSEAPPRIDRIRSDLPAGLAVVIGRLLEKLPEDRYENADGVIQDLDRVRDPAQTVSFFPGVGPSAPKPPPVPRSSRRRSRRILLAGALAVLVLAILGGFRLLGGRGRGYPGRKTVEATLETVHRAVRERDFAAFSACFAPDLLVGFFESDPESEFRDRAAKVADFEFRAEIPIRGASDGEASIRMVSGAPLPTVLGLDPQGPLKLTLESDGDGWRIREVQEPRGGPWREGSPRATRERRMLAGRLEGLFREIANRGPEVLRRLIDESRLSRKQWETVKARLIPLIAKGKIQHEILESESRVSAGRAVIVVRCPDLARAFERTDDRIEIEFARSLENPTWRPRRVQFHEN